MGRFFHPKTYPPKDIDFIVQKLSGDPNDVDIDEYKTSTCHRHREIILQGFGFRAYSSDGKYMIPYLKKPPKWRNAAQQKSNQTKSNI